MSTVTYTYAYAGKTFWFTVDNGVVFPADGYDGGGSISMLSVRIG